VEGLKERSVFGNEAIVSRALAPKRENKLFCEKINEGIE
jgi:hypothetical protein